MQGCTSAFFHSLAVALRREGYRTARIDFNVGDVLFWYGEGARWHYRQAVDEFGPLLEAWVVKHAITDVIMLGDTRPMHRIAIQVCRRLDLTVHVFEEGYLRPNWLTYERDGINGYSRLPKDPDWYKRVAADLPEPVPVHARLGSLTLLAVWELAYHLPNLLNPIFFPGYRTHRPVNSAMEFYGWARRFACMPWYQQRDERRIKKLLASGAQYFLLPMQLDGDSQVVFHSRFTSIATMLAEVLTSFATHAPAEAKLVIKNHPLDTGLTAYKNIVVSLSQALQISKRVIYLESGNLEDLLPHASGLVTINSTVGMAALERCIPVCCLGKAVYNLNGLTSQNSLDQFWCQPQAVDSSLFRAFKKTMVYSTQIQGGFYSRSGCDMAIAQVVPMMTAARSRLQALM